MTSEAIGIDSESLLFAKLKGYKNEIPNMISRRQYNDRRKITSSLCNTIWERFAAVIDGGEDYFCIDSKPIYRSNQKNCKPTFPAFAKARKRIETIYSQLCDQFMIIRIYVKDAEGLFVRIIGKISAFTVLQDINYKNNKPIGRVKYVLI